LAMTFLLRGGMAEVNNDGQISIGNEFTNIELPKVLARNGERM
jgi:hypothetical protein